MVGPQDGERETVSRYELVPAERVAKWLGRDVEDVWFWIAEGVSFSARMVHASVRLIPDRVTADREPLFSVRAVGDFLRMCAADVNGVSRGGVEHYEDGNSPLRGRHVVAFASSGPVLNGIPFGPVSDAEYKRIVFDATYRNQFAPGESPR